MGGACNLEFKADTFDEISKLSRGHGMEMFQQNDEPHLQAMNEMQKMMNVNYLMLIGIMMELLIL